MSIKQTITLNLLNILGWRTKRHIVFIGGDYWGSIRMPSKEVYKNKPIVYSLGNYFFDGKSRNTSWNI